MSDVQNSGTILILLPFLAGFNNISVIQYRSSHGMEHIPIVEYSDNEKSFQDVNREFRKEYEFFRELFEI